ncbi:hypothetical protein [Streptomyces sp. NA03103]|uniref:hypothetical protein n=1 Tax=Streptomyces sp. NA03103 TaxID=2742134 RepID=UPI0020CADD25|nr:hypothetical protein [Streptomyces sp. NA03103]
MEELVGMEATEDANDRGPLACHLYALIRYAQMLDDDLRQVSELLGEQTDEPCAPTAWA